MEKKKYLNVALPKGRLGEKVYSYFEREGMEAEGIREESRKLIFAPSGLSGDNSVGIAILAMMRRM